MWTAREDEVNSKDEEEEEEEGDAMTSSPSTTFASLLV